MRIPIATWGCSACAYKQDHDPKDRVCPSCGGAMAPVDTDADKASVVVAALTDIEAGLSDVEREAQAGRIAQELERWREEIDAGDPAQAEVIRTHLTTRIREATDEVSRLRTRRR